MFQWRGHSQHYLSIQLIIREGVTKGEHNTRLPSAYFNTFDVMNQVQVEGFLLLKVKCLFLGDWLLLMTVKR